MKFSENQKKLLLQLIQDKIEYGVSIELTRDLLQLYDKIQTSKKRKMPCSLCKHQNTAWCQVKKEPYSCPHYEVKQ